MSPAEALAAYSTKFYLRNNAYPQDATWAVGAASYEAATAEFDKRIVGFDTATFSPAPSGLYFGATSISCSDPNAETVE